MPDQANNIIYLDFDGTLTGLSGRPLFDTQFPELLKDANASDTRASKLKEYFEEYFIKNTSEVNPPEENGSLEERIKYSIQQLADKNSFLDALKITPQAKDFLKKVSALHPEVELVIISRNYENYIKALLEYAEIPTENISFYTRNGLGEDKNQAAATHEQLKNPGLRLCCDDDETDRQEMAHGVFSALNPNRDEKGFAYSSIHQHTEKPGEFKWDNYLKEIYASVSAPEYLHGRVKSRNHYYEARIAETASDELKEKYGNLSGDGLKRAIINELKDSIKGVEKASDYEQLKERFLASEEYQILKTSQGRFTKISGLKTDSQKAVETIFKEKEKELDIKDRFHLFKARFNESTPNQIIPLNEQYKNLRGDRLKAVIIEDLRAAVSKIDDSGKLEEYILDYKSSEQYKVLAQGQGIPTQLANLGSKLMAPKSDVKILNKVAEAFNNLEQTDSQKEVEAIFNEKREALSPSLVAKL